MIVDAIGYYSIKVAGNLLLLGNLLIGLSYGWWIAKHNRHHAHPNQVDRAPGIAGGAIAFTQDHARARSGPGAWLARHQAWLFFPMLLLEGLNLHVAGVRALLTRTGASRTHHRAGATTCAVSSHATVIGRSASGTF